MHLPANHKAQPRFVTTLWVERNLTSANKCPSVKPIVLDLWRGSNGLFTAVRGMDAEAEPTRMCLWRAVKSPLLPLCAPIQHLKLY